MSFADNKNNRIKIDKNPFGDKKILFPVIYDLKVIMDTLYPEEKHRNDLSKIFLELDIPFKNWRSKLSSKNTYVSLTVKVKIDSQENLEKLYAEIKKLDSVKVAI